MRKCKIVALALVVLASPAVSLAAGGAVPTDEQARTDLPVLEDAVCRANAAFDGAFFERLTANEAIFTTPDGSTLGRADVLGIFKTPKESRSYKIESCQNTDVVVRPLGAAAVVTGVATVKGQGPTGAYTDRSRYTHTFAWRDGRWQLVAAHGSHLPDKPDKPDKK